MIFAEDLISVLGSSQVIFLQLKRKLNYLHCSVSSFWSRKYICSPEGEGVQRLNSFFWYRISSRTQEVLSECWPARRQTGIWDVIRSSRLPGGREQRHPQWCLRVVGAQRAFLSSPLLCPSPPPRPQLWIRAPHSPPFYLFLLCAHPVCSPSPRPRSPQDAGDISFLLKGKRLWQWGCQKRTLETRYFFFFSNRKRILKSWPESFVPGRNWVPNLPLGRSFSQLSILRWA